MADRREIYKRVGSKKLQEWHDNKLLEFSENEDLSKAFKSYVSEKIHKDVAEVWDLLRIGTIAENNHSAGQQEARKKALDILKELDKNNELERLQMEAVKLNLEKNNVALKTVFDSLNKDLTPRPADDFRLEMKSFGTVQSSNRGN
ncbi:uncharacterized protein LOC132195215 [Neocloeon triangulifer]|uniref:uncharacterized protein LOC132195215 n=1 Tax=Neocloeon triangulifer TaxID=2078957 RepID=UPI00286EEEAE|nr:uncharacterized protein LOC132195215 [Neocloeon triangulifer]